MRTLRGAKFNNFGVLRLFFASLVIISHSPEMIDGNRSRELLTRLFGTLSFGDVAVDGFFLVSGYLITKSYAERPEWYSYLKKRVLRIYPGYMAAFWLCVIVIAPLAGHQGTVLEFFWRNIGHSVRLEPPEVRDVFDGMPYPVLNGAMWTIAFEFRCYLAVLVVGSVVRRFGCHRARYLRWILAAAVFIGLTSVGVGKVLSIPGFHARVFKTSVADDIRLFSVFGVGVLYYLFRNEIVRNGYRAILALVLLVVCLFSQYTAELGLSIFGGYITFWIAFKCRVVETFFVNSNTDISYGLYLYAWPIANLIIWYHRSINPWSLCVLTLLAAGAAGFASWVLIEKRANAFAHNRSSEPKILQY